MMKLKAFGTEFSISFPAVAFLCLTIICDKKGNMLFCLLASFLHEIGHLFIMKLEGVSLHSVSFKIGEVVIKADSSSLSYRDEILISSGGVFVNFILAVIFYFIYTLSGNLFCHSFFVSNAAIGVFNLLPIRFLDGGDILWLILQNFLTRKVTDVILTILTVIFIVPVIVSGFIFILNSKYNYSLLLAALYLICTLVSKEFKNVS